MKRLLTGLVCAVGLAVTSQVAWADGADGAHAAPPANTFFTPNPGELRVDNNPRGALYRRALLERFYRGTPGAVQAYEAHLAVADCMVDLSGGRAARLVGGDGTDDPRFRRLNNAMYRQYNNCTSINYLADLSPSLLNAALAERLVLRDSGPLASRTGSVDYQPQAQTFDALAQCAVSRSPDRARAVLRAEVGSPVERAALSDLYVAAGACDPAALAASTPVLVQRARIAERLYALGTPQN